MSDIESQQIEAHVSAALNAGIVSLPEIPLPSDRLPENVALERGPMVEELQVPAHINTLLFSISNGVRNFCAEQGLKRPRIFVIGSQAVYHARVCLDGSHNEISPSRDLDFLIIGISQDTLISERFIALIESVLPDSAEVTVGSGSTDTRKRYIRIQMEDGYTIDLSTPFQPQGSPTDDKEALYSLATGLVAIEILETHQLQFVSAYEHVLQQMQRKEIIEFPLPSLGPEIYYLSANLRVIQELARTPGLSTRAEVLNQLRRWWWDFRTKPYTDSELQQISSAVETGLERGFAAAQKTGKGLEYLSLLMHTGAIHALFPISWTCSSLQLGDKESGNGIIGFLELHGYSLETLRQAFEVHMDPQAAQNIRRLVAEVEEYELPANWVVSYRDNILVQMILLQQNLPIDTLLPGRTGFMQAYEILGAQPPQPSWPHKKSGEEYRLWQIRHAYWNVVGPFIEGMMYAEALLKDQVLVLGRWLIDLDQVEQFQLLEGLLRVDWTSIIRGKQIGINQKAQLIAQGRLPDGSKLLPPPRIGINLERVNTQLMWDIARGELGSLFTTARTISKLFAEQYFEPSFEEVQSSLPRGVKLTVGERLQIMRLQRMRRSFDYHLEIFAQRFAQERYPGDDPKAKALQLLSTSLFIFITATAYRLREREYEFVHN